MKAMLCKAYGGPESLVLEEIDSASLDLDPSEWLKPHPTYPAVDSPASIAVNCRPLVSGPIQIIAATISPDAAIQSAIAPPIVIPPSCSSPNTNGVIEPSAAPT